MTRRKPGDGGITPYVRADGRTTYSVHYRLPDGRKKWERGLPTMAAAKKRLRERLVDLERGAYVEPTKLTVGEYVEREWLPSLRVATSTAHSYRRNLRHHVLPRLGATPLAAVTGTRLTALYNDLLAAGRHDGRGGLSPRTVRYVHTIVHRVLGDAAEAGLLPKNPAAVAKPPSARQATAPEMRTWTRDQLRAFLTAEDGDRLYPLWVLFATTGVRRGEALGLRWRDVDLDAATVAIRQTIGSIAGKVVASSSTKSGKARVVDLDPTTVAVLRSHRARQAQERLAIGAGYRDAGLVFADVTGREMHPERLSRTFQRRIGAAQRRGLEVPMIRLHDMRHTWATLALGDGVHPKIVSERLGHSKIAITLDIYSHALPTIQREAAERVASLIFGGGA
jgi:integrase